MNKLFLIVIILTISQASYSQKGSLLFNFEPALRYSRNSDTDNYFLVLRGEGGIGYTLNKFSLGIAYEYVKIYSNFDSPEIALQNNSSSVGLFLRYHFPWKVKDERVRFYSEATISYANLQPFGVIEKSNKFEYGSARLTFGFEVVFLKYFYLNCGFRPIYYFVGNFVPTIRPLLECRIPLKK